MHFFATVSSITRLNATPLYIDINIGNFMLSAAATEQFLVARCRKRDGETMESYTGLRVKSLLPIHPFDQCAAMNEDVNLGQKYQLHVVEEVASAYGSRLKLCRESYKLPIPAAISALLIFVE